jgi:hypothetical protein
MRISNLKLCEIQMKWLKIGCRKIDAEFLWIFDRNEMQQ